METTRTDPTPARLPHELTEFLLELALALQRHGMYPGGHPTVDAAVEALTGRLGGLLRERPMLSLGVARRQIVIEGVATDSKHPVLRVLSERLHRHRLGAVAFRRGLGARELQSFLQAISADPDRAGAVGQAGGEDHGRWAHIGLYPITYEQLQLAAEEPDEEPEEGEGSGTAAAQLWIGLAQAALARAGHEDEDVVEAEEPAAAPAPGGGMEQADPLQVARAINENHGAQAYDQMIVGYMLQLANELRRDGGANAGVRRRVSVLIRELEPRTLQKLLHMGGDMAQRNRFLLDATDSLGTDAMLDLVRAAATAQQQDISTSLVRMLRKMSALAEHGAGGIAVQADAQLREHVRELIESWSLPDPNPDAYTHALHGMSLAHAGVADAVRDQAEAGALRGAEPLRILQMALEVEETGPACARAIAAMLAEGRQAELFELLDLAAQEGTAAQLLWQQVGTREHAESMLAAVPVDFDSLDQLLARMPAATVLDLLLDTIAASESRATRMAVFVRIAALGEAAVEPIIARIGDERWYVVRNMLALLNEIGTWPASFSALPYARHEQPMVRREALRLAARMPRERDTAVTLALGDPDERAFRVGINAGRDGGVPAAAVRHILRRMEDPTLPAEVHGALVRLLDGHAAAVVETRLVELTLQKRRFRRARLAPKSPVMLAAIWVLAGASNPQGGAARALALARASADADVVRAATRT